MHSIAYLWKEPVVYRYLQVETREDEEQSIKLAEILELLLAAGYFRARIKGLSPFDKVNQIYSITLSNLPSSGDQTSC